MKAQVMAVALVLVAIAFYEISAAFAVMLFGRVGPVGMVAYRNVFGALALVLAVRPRIGSLSRRAWAWATGLGLSLAVMNSLFYLALDRIGLGATVTLEAVGPLVLSVALSRTLRSWLWAALAFVGVVLLQRGGFEQLDIAGFLLALGAGAAWAGYIVCTRRLGQELPGLSGLAVAMSIAGLCVLPFGVASAGPALVAPTSLLLGALVAICSSSIPYAMEMVALRTLPTQAFSVMMTLAPAAAALYGLAFLHQT
jgi:inner membrane transporter RhtA